MTHYCALIAEDETLIAMLLEDMLSELGCDKIETSGNVADALTAITNGKFDFAVLDLDLNGERSYPIAEALRARNIPFVFSSGYGAVEIDGGFDGVPVLQKPFQINDLEQIIHGTLGINFGR